MKKARTYPQPVDFSTTDWDALAPGSALHVAPEVLREQAIAGTERPCFGVGMPLEMDNA